MNNHNNDPFISICILTYNTREYLLKCLNSFVYVLSRACELLLLDDCSTDGTEKIIEKFITEHNELSCSVQFIRNEKNLGSAGTRNVALENAKGLYVTFIDGDDLVYGDTLLEMISLAQTTCADLVVAPFEMVNESNKYYIANYAWNDRYLNVYQALGEEYSGSLCNKIFKRDIIVKNSLRFIEGANIWEDWMFCVKFFHYAKKIEYIPKLYYLYNISNSASQLHNTRGRTLEVIRNVSEINDFLSSLGYANDYLDLLKARKFVAKLGLLNPSSLNDWKKSFPEASSLRILWKLKTHPLKTKIKCTLVMCHFGWMLQILRHS